MRHGSHASDSEVFNLDMSNHGGVAFAQPEWSPSAKREGRAIASVVAPVSTFDIKLLEAVRRLKPLCTTASGVEYGRMASLLAKAGFKAVIKSPEAECKCPDKSRKCLEKLSHTFLVYTTPGQEEGIIEPRLKEQFEIAHPTPSYQTLLEQLPAEFVGPAARLRALVEAVSASMAKAFKEMDRPLPPWRRLPATLSKWGLDKTEVLGSKFGGVPSMARPEWPCGKQPLQERGKRNVGFPEESPFALPRVMKAAVPAGPAGTAGRPENGGQDRVPRISQLARNLEDMAALQKSKRALDSPCAAKASFKRAPSWDFSGLPPVNTVRRSGRVHVM